MRLIDEKGRLFGKINIIDFFVILFLVSLTPMFYFIYKILNKPRTENITVTSEVKQKLVKDFLEIDLDCLFIKLEPQVAEAISVGNKEIDNTGRVIAEILSVGKVSPYKYELEMGAPQKIVKNDPDFKQIPVTLRIKTEIRQDKLYYKDKQILYNSIFDFTTDKYRIETIPYFKDISTPASTNVEQDALEKLEQRIAVLEKLEQRIAALEKLEQRIDALEKQVNGILSSLKIKKVKYNK